MIKIGGFQDYIMNKFKLIRIKKNRINCFLYNIYLNLLKMPKIFKTIIFFILYLFTIKDTYCFDIRKNSENVNNIENKDNIENSEYNYIDEEEEIKKKKKEKEEKKKKKEEKKLLEEQKKKEEKEIKSIVKNFKSNNDSEKDKKFKNKIKEDIKNKEKEVENEKNKLLNKKNKKKSSFIKDLEKKIEQKDKELIDKNNLSEEEKNKNRYKELQNEYIKQEIERIIEIPEQKNLSKSFDEKLVEINTKYHEQKYLKVLKPIESIEFCGLDFFSILLYLANLKKEGYIYEVFFNLINVNWGAVLSTGLEGGLSFIKKNNIKSNFPFINFTFSFRYNNNGNLKFLLGLSRVNIDNEGNYQIPFWWGITPININFDIYKFKDTPIVLFLNFEIIFKRIITSDLKDCRDKINSFPINKVCPYIRDYNEINIFNIFLGMKVALTFKYIL